MITIEVLNNNEIQNLGQILVWWKSYEYVKEGGISFDPDLNLFKSLHGLSVVTSVFDLPILANVATIVKSHNGRTTSFIICL